MKSKKLLTTLIIVVLCSVLVIALRQQSVRIPCRGIIKAVGVEVYWNKECTNAVTNIDWGLLTPGTTSSVTVYIKNTKTADVTLTLSVGNWTPSEAEPFFTQSWNYTDQTLTPGQVIETLLSLQVSVEITGITNFAYDIIITAVG